MKYNLQFDVEGRAPVVPLNLKLDEKTVREFKYVAKQHRVSMTHVLTKMIQEWVNEYRSKGEMKQRALL